MTSIPRARELGPDAAVLSYFSLQFADFDERLDAAAEAGFQGIGLLLHDYRRMLRKGRTPKELREAVDARGLAVVEIEALMGWGAADFSFAAADLDTVCEMAELFESRHLQAVGPFEGSLDDAGRAFARACDRAADVGLRVALEFLPPNNIPDAGVALDIVERAGRSNGGLCVDSWHHFRGARDEVLLRDVPADRLVSVQLSDGTLEPTSDDYIPDCMTHRVPTGEGEFDLPRLLSILDEAGCTAPRCFEVISAELQGLPHREAARRIAAGARALPRSANA